MKGKANRSKITKTLGSDFMELLTEVAPLIGPRIDCIWTENLLYITADLAGARPHDINLGINSGSLIISGVIHPPANIPAKKIIRQERFFGPFQKKIKLPVHCLPDRLKAELEYGILTITIPLFSKTSAQEESHDDHSV
ncbi:Hsp20/alpha crystallin family protein [Neobacillus piezotolerans]|uniref:Hsp20/alpha crystallin family protein n=1 Tax=Neobacillus piezotolerans TaxID=2259171 RepID=UPI0015F1537C|nr:Hsp20/alpha crystallin family protein [Neobacillus piezotolerans]